MLGVDLCRLKPPTMVVGGSSVSCLLKQDLEGDGERILCYLVRVQVMVNLPGRVQVTVKGILVLCLSLVPNCVPRRSGFVPLRLEPFASGSRCVIIQNGAHLFRRPARASTCSAARVAGVGFCFHEASR